MKATILVTATLLLAGAQAILAQSSNSAQDFSQARAKYLRLNRQIFARHEDLESQRIHVTQSDQVKAIGAKLHEILRGTIISVLNSPHATGDDVKNAINEIQGELAFLPWNPQRINLPLAEFFQLNASENVMAAYAILEGGDAIPESKAYIEFYSHADGTWKLQAATGSDFDGSTLSVAPMTAGVGGEKWFLAWGTRFGDDGGRLNLRLYGFNGTEVRTVWKRNGLTRGILTLRTPR